MAEKRSDRAKDRIECKEILEWKGKGIVKNAQKQTAIFVNFVNTY